jgi:hypothetical protein
VRLDTVRGTWSTTGTGRSIFLCRLSLIGMSTMFYDTIISPIFFCWLWSFPLWSITTLTYLSPHPIASCRVLTLHVVITIPSSPTSISPSFVVMTHHHGYSPAWMVSLIMMVFPFIIIQVPHLIGIWGGSFALVGEIDPNYPSQEHWSRRPGLIYFDGGYLSDDLVPYLQYLST